MSYSTPAAPQLDTLDDLASRYVDVDAMPWTDLPFEGVKAKVLLRDEHGVRTALVRMAPGAEIPFHEHTGLEQTYILEGSLSDHDGESTAGQYVWRLKRQPPHRPFARWRADAGDVREAQRLPVR